ncbi:MAG: hypothetical protein J5449_06600 [Oscillospiraceae bacterium]|nr:hypothetical protein [Oscillospiraceae bacterium]
MNCCEDCIYYSYDEEYDSYFCEQELDEDEMAEFLLRKRKSCPFYHPGDAGYYLASKQ